MPGSCALHMCLFLAVVVVLWGLQFAFNGSVRGAWVCLCVPAKAVFKPCSSCEVQHSYIPTVCRQP